MHSDVEILERLTKLGVPITGVIVSDPTDAGRRYVFVPVTRSKQDRQEPSNKKLGEAREVLASLGISVEFVLTDDRRQDVEAGVRATLLHSFGHYVRNAFLSSKSGDATVWIDAKRALPDKILHEIRSKSAVVLDQVSLRLLSVFSTTEQNVPSKTVCMRALRQLAPATPEQLIAQLTKQKFDIPSTDWMIRRLDLLRRGGMILRLGDARYALSVRGLRALGTAKSAASPDIARLLALAAGRR